MKPYPLPASESASGDDKVPKGKVLFDFVLDCLEECESRSEICEKLVAFGYSENDAAMIVADVTNRRRHHLETQRTAGDSEEKGTNGTTNMVVGGVICVVGVTITVISFLVASGTGGSHIIAWGAIVWGAIQFVRGLIQANEFKNHDR